MFRTIHKTPPMRVLIASTAKISVVGHSNSPVLSSTTAKGCWTAEASAEFWRLNY